MGREVVRRFIKPMTATGVYKAVIEQNKRECARVLGEAITEDLGRTISALAQHRQAKKRVILEQKLNKLQASDTRSLNLVHNLSSKQRTQQQVRVLRHEACFNTADADAVNFIAALESMLVRTETTEDEKHSV
ncbi:unnamed protein product [Schistocephalus solidus]|uniref:Flagellar export protein FliJ n=1 Tax=Schistocephalus solidus TaxID=70667 RepID=A0A183TB42_SCHSO|nr:unnamed protein product [Schistocephalus solidus]